MKTITVTEDDIRSALGPISGYSPLANELVRHLFGYRREPSELDLRVLTLEKKSSRDGRCIEVGQKENQTRYLVHITVMLMLAAGAWVYFSSRVVEYTEPKINVKNESNNEPWTHLSKRQVKALADEILGKENK